MLMAKIIQPSNSPCSAPVLMIPKKNGEYRFCIDFRKLNAVTEQDSFPLPRIDDILDRLVQFMYASTLDLKMGYWPNDVDEKSRAKTAFSDGVGHWECLKLPYGLKNGPADFSRTMFMILGDLAFVEIYIDDIIVHSNSYEEHIEHIKIVFKRLKEANFKINPEKCNWFAKELKVLGHVVSERGVEMDLDKVQAINEMTYPRNVKQVQQFLGLCGYYRRFVKDFANIAAPWYGLLKKDVIWEINEACELAFNELKLRLVKYPILRQPNFKFPLIVYTYAS